MYNQAKYFRRPKNVAILPSFGCRRQRIPGQSLVYSREIQDFPPRNLLCNLITAPTSMTSFGAKNYMQIGVVNPYVVNIRPNSVFKN